MKYGYIRVSSKEQNIARQLSAISREGIAKEQIYIDKMSGKDFERENYQKLTTQLKENDELFVKSIDRLGRNYGEIIEQWNLLTKIKNIHIIVLDCTLLDTRNQVNGLTGKFLADMVLQILSYVAEVERENIYQRQMEGIQEAKKRGVRFGREMNALPVHFDEIAEQWRTGKIGLRQGARNLEINVGTFSRLLKRHNITK